MLTRADLATAATQAGLTYEEARAALSALVVRELERREAAIARETAEVDEQLRFVDLVSVAEREEWRCCLYCGRGFWARRSWSRYCPETNHRQLDWQRRERAKRRRQSEIGVAA